MYGKMSAKLIKTKYNCIITRLTSALPLQSLSIQTERRVACPLILLILPLTLPVRIKTPRGTLTASQELTQIAFSLNWSPETLDSVFCYRQI